ncbi:MAG TPA: hypothetical protein DD379_20800 [Cyanobacteria bacterium UBA11162]|nr:hypothetical protein [Cyanobacteria bacterium UBA11162]
MKLTHQEQAQQVILVSFDSTGNSALSQDFQSGSFVPMLMYGGVAVAVILAMAYFSQLQLKELANVLRIVANKIK